MKKKLIILFVSLTLNLITFASLRLPNIFVDSMVLQRGIKIPVWGWADPNEKITVQFHDQKKNTISNADGKWKLILSEEQAGGPFHLIISDIKNKIDISNVLVGEVWLCSGQSNMEFTVNNVINSSSEISSSNFPLVRHIKILNTTSEKPLDDIRPTSGWKAALPGTVGNFTAVGYFFARELYNKLHVPVGLINSSWGGTDVETWISRKAFENSDEFSEMIKGVPQINLDSIAKEQSKALLYNVIKVQGNPPGNGNVNLWKEKNYDDHQWPQMVLPGLWESQSLKDLDGIVWFRKIFILDSNDILKPSKLSLAMIDDNDEAFINGVKIGATNGYNIKRLYSIPEGVLIKGENVVSIKVEDTGGGGGVYGDSTDLFFSNGDKKIPLNGNWKFQVETIKLTGNSMSPNAFPSLLFNGMINPLIPFGIKGVLWYQGESNAGRAIQYRKSFPLLITDWRSRWEEGSFPFYFVQLASFNAGNGNSLKGSPWAELREAQDKTLNMPNTGMAVTVDIGNSTDIHPKNKQDVGKRLAAIALNNLYGHKMIFTGPSFKMLIIKKSSIIISFKDVGSGLTTSNKENSLKGFEIAGTDKIFYPALAVIKGNQVVVSSTLVSKPVAVHYALADDAGESNLFNREGFPAAPFRTDQWDGITKNAKYLIHK